MINSKNFLTIILPYITISCGLYHIVYWKMFGLNGLNLISTENIIKSSINSIVFTFVGSIFGYFIMNNIILKGKNYEKSEIDQDKKGKFFYILFLSVIFSILFLVNIFLVNFDNGTTCAFYVAIIIIESLNHDYVNNLKLSTNFNNKFLLLILIYFPLNSIGSAYDDAIKIVDNKHYSFTIIKKWNEVSNKNDFDTIKLIGNDNNKFVFIDIRNENIYIIENDTIKLKIK